MCWFSSAEQGISSLGLQNQVNKTTCWFFSKGVLFLSRFLSFSPGNSLHSYKFKEVASLRIKEFKPRYYS
jgi:hypothetical protein